MKLKRELINLIIIGVLCGMVYFFLPQNAGSIPGYDRYIYYPLQSFRGWLFGTLPFSLGDIIYIAAGIVLMVTLIKWVSYLFRIREYGELLAISVLKTITTVFWVYLFFIIGWGANYYKPSLTEYWHITPPPSATIKNETEKAEGRKKALADLIAFDRFLVNKLNVYAPFYRALSLREITDRAKAYYGTYTNSKLKQYGLQIKPSLFGNLMERLAVEGYYNPFTGEGQVNSNLPAFTLPFLVCHEMAHQAGIGSEEDANLMAYTLGTTTPDSAFRYSCYLNIWLYTNNRLYRRDSVQALQYEAMLNKLTTAHIDTLEQISRMYNNEISHYSNELYDSYLKMQDQKEGIHSYGNVTASAWLLERKRSAGITGLINIP